MVEDIEGISNPADRRTHPKAEGMPAGSSAGSERQFLRSQRLEALGMLVGGVAHDFNNILNVITGHALLMEKWRSDPERFMKSYDAVKKATERGASTARQLLTFTKESDILVQQIDPGEIVDEIVGLLKDTFPENVAFVVKKDDGIPRIPADPNQIHQALMNLCVNARDAMPGGGTINIVLGISKLPELSKHYPKPDGELFVCLTVSDTGSGIEKEVLARIFEPFFTTKAGIGTGLGLAVVYTIVKAHGGFIDVRSAPGEGTSFSLYFPIPPRASDSIPGEKENAELRLGGDDDLPTGHGEIILAIEDEAPLRDFLDAILTESGYKVLRASGGLEALQVYKENMNQIDLVLLDMGLPEMGGTEVLSGLLLLNPDARVISASGYLDPELKSEALEIGALDFLAKPYLIEELLAKVHRALRMGEAG